VQDTGVGFDPHEVDRLFEAFYTTKSGGMGIGLSVSRAIIERHHGRLWAAPNAGPGATFAFALPRGREGVTGTDSPGATRTPAMTEAAHVMRSP
jgi:signal transduction histidine kinase